MAIPHPASGADAVGELKEHSRRLMQSLRRALVEALAAAGVDPLRPRHAARALGVDKTLMWRVSHIVGEPDVFRAMAHVPRRSGVGILCRALARAGVARAIVEPLRDALVAFDALAAQHGGDRATFELLAAGFASSEHNSPSLEQGRRFAFRGNSSIWGVQARLQLATCILLPNDADPRRIDLVRLFGFVDLLRLRADVAWPLDRRAFFDERAERRPASPGEALDESGGPGAGALLRGFSSASLPELHVEGENGSERCVLPAGLPGRTGALTALFGCRHRALGAPGADVLEVHLVTPVEQLQFDLLVHRDLGRNGAPRVALHGALDGRRCGLVPLFAESVADLGEGISGSATPYLPAYVALLEWALQRLRAEPAAFRVFRFAMAYPPIPSLVRLDRILPTDPAGPAGGRPEGRS